MNRKERGRNKYILIDVEIGKLIKTKIIKARSQNYSKN